MGVCWWWGFSTILLALGPAPGSWEHLAGAPGGAGRGVGGPAAHASLQQPMGGGGGGSGRERGRAGRLEARTPLAST